jgi:hypothetical protein
MWNELKCFKANKSRLSCSLQLWLLGATPQRRQRTLNAYAQHVHREPAQQWRDLAHELRYLTANITDGSSMPTINRPKSHFAESASLIRQSVWVA